MKKGVLAVVMIVAVVLIGLFIGTTDDNQVPENWAGQN